MHKLSDTQSILLTAAANRDDANLLPPPDGLKARGAALDRTLNSLLRRGLIATTPTSVAEQRWKHLGTEDHQAFGTGLVIAAAGFLALGLEPRTPDLPASGPADSSAEAEPSDVTATPSRPGGKLGAVIDAIARPQGASLDELTALSGWLPHTTRAAVTRLRQRGHDVTLRKVEGRRAYHLAAKA